MIQKIETLRVILCWLPLVCQVSVSGIDIETYCSSLLLWLVSDFGPRTREVLVPAFHFSFLLIFHQPLFSLLRVITHNYGILHWYVLVKSRSRSSFQSLHKLICTSDVRVPQRNMPRRILYFKFCSCSKIVIPFVVSLNVLGQSLIGCKTTHFYWTFPTHCCIPSGSFGPNLGTLSIRKPSYTGLFSVPAFVSIDHWRSK